MASWVRKCLPCRSLVCVRVETEKRGAHEGQPRRGAEGRACGGGCRAGATDQSLRRVSGELVAARGQVARLQEQRELGQEARRGLEEGRQELVGEVEEESTQRTGLDVGTKRTMLPWLSTQRPPAREAVRRTSGNR